MQKDEIYLFDLWRVLVREWKWFLALLLLVLAATYAFAHLARRQWEATAWVQIGQVAQAPPGQDPKVESLQRVLERLQTVAFQNEAMESIGIAPDSPEARLYRHSMKLEPMPYAGPMVRINVRAWSPQQARQFAQATVARLQAIHGSLEASPLALAHARLDEVQGELKGALAERERLSEAAHKDDAGGGMSPLAVAMLASKSEDIRNLQMARSDLLTRLSATYTYETSMPWPVYVSDHPVFPNPMLTWGLGLLVGVGLGGFAAVARNAARRRAAEMREWRLTVQPKTPA
ncbi:lipopolysaccharide biosynthesis protein [Dyella solisilvae]|uniref:Lipopolysaccharide biosynthesis protein n=1 Tax=Dyella solisilvae TaxID=1920168 RepID=A0A370K5U9_9GAMM|nr:Wzz/FepE/Etk N-terminal domain-containing protein [Dyella solisilvae]RDI98004.1 lipopolysaccharide biosynthesis protein [Dyella solisilvae]